MDKTGEISKRKVRIVRNNNNKEEEPDWVRNNKEEEPDWVKNWESLDNDYNQTETTEPIITMPNIQDKDLYIDPSDTLLRIIGIALRYEQYKKIITASNKELNLVKYSTRAEWLYDKLCGELTVFETTRVEEKRLEKLFSGDLAKENQRKEQEERKKINNDQIVNVYGLHVSRGKVEMVKEIVDEEKEKSRNEGFNDGFTVSTKNYIRAITKKDRENKKLSKENQALKIKTLELKLKRNKKRLENITDVETINYFKRCLIYQPNAEIGSRELFLHYRDWCSTMKIFKQEALVTNEIKWGRLISENHIFRKERKRSGTIIYDYILP